MKSKHFPLTYLVYFVVGAFILSGCMFPFNTTTPTNPSVAFTQAAQTVMAQLTQAAESFTKTPTPMPPTATFEPTNTNTPQPELPSATPSSLPTIIRPTKVPPTPVVLFTDDFSKPAGWVVLEEKDFSLGYTKNGYRIFVNLVTSNSPVFTVREVSYSDVQVEVDVSKVAGPNDSYFGVLCRFQDQSNYYRFVIGVDGYYGIGKKSNGQFFDMASGTGSSAIKTGNAVNHLKAECIGNNLTLSVNGQNLLSVIDNTFTQGSVGMVAGTMTTKGADILFDNLVLSQP